MESFKTEYFGRNQRAMAAHVGGVALLGWMVWLGACCPKPPLLNRSPIAPITLEEQVSRLDARTKALPRLKAKTVTRGVELTYKDKNKQVQTQNVEGTLLMRQEENGNASVMLLGTAFDQQMFQAGRNATDWWFICEWIRRRPGRAMRKPIDYESMSSPGGGIGTGILRADLVQDLMGLRQLGGWYNRPGEAVVMRVDDVRRSFLRRM